jgi:hypothetical protein
MNEVIEGFKSKDAACLSDLVTNVSLQGIEFLN